MKDLEKHFDSIGDKGMAERLQAIAEANLGLRSEAASRVLQKRNRRKELMAMGLSHHDAIIITQKEDEPLTP